MTWQIILFLLPIISVHCLPVGNRKGWSGNDPTSVVTMSKSIWNMLIENEERAEGLYALYDKAGYLAKDKLFKSEVCSYQTK